MTEDDVRRIVREELAKRDASYPYVPHGIPVHWPVEPLGLPKYEYLMPEYQPPGSSGK